MAFTENFRQIEFNPDKEIREMFRATQGDTKSQGFNVVVVLGGKKKVITTETMSFFAQKPDGTRVTDMAVKDGDGFKIELKNQVFAVPGVVVCTLVLRGANGEKLAGRQFKIFVAGSIEDGAIISEDEREFLDKAFDMAADIIPRLDNVDSEITLARGTEPTLGARLDADKAEVNAQLVDIGNDIGDIQDLQSQVSDLQAFVGYTDDDIMGVEVDFKNKKFTRLAGAVNRTPGAMFDDVQAYGGRKRCILTDEGVVLAYHGESGYTETGALTQAIVIEVEPAQGEEPAVTETYEVGTKVQVMVEQPKFYYKVVPLQLDKVVDGKGFHMRKARYYVSDVKKAGFKLHPAFIHDGKEKNFIYLSAYEGSLYDVSASTYILDDAQIGSFVATTGDKLSSIANAKPASGLTQGLTRNGSRIIAQNRGKGWFQSYAATVAASQLLFLIEYASFNTQTAIGMGNVSKASGEGNESEITGATTNLGNKSGAVTNINGINIVSYRGEENFWGNIWKWIDGLNIEAKGLHNLYVADNGFADNIGESPYKDAGITLSKTSGYISAFAYNEEFDWLFFSSETVSNSSLPVGDYFYQNHTYNGWFTAVLGGDWYSSSAAGGFYWLVNYTASTHSRIRGGRLVYIPDVA